MCGSFARRRNPIKRLLAAARVRRDSTRALRLVKRRFERASIFFIAKIAKLHIGHVSRWSSLRKKNVLDATDDVTREMHFTREYFDNFIKGLLSHT